MINFRSMYSIYEIGKTYNLLLTKDKAPVTSKLLDFLTTQNGYPLWVLWERDNTIMSVTWNDILEILPNQNEIYTKPFGTHLNNW